MIRTRFAPSPTGPLHLGHAYAAMMAKHLGDEMLLRIEDIDQSRARPEWEAAIHADLAWLGIAYPTPAMRQSDRQVAYDGALDQLWDAGLLFPCTCSRADIKTAARAPQEGAPLLGPDGIVYPGTCRNVPLPTERPTDTALRLNMTRAAQAIHFIDKSKPHHITTETFLETIGDVVLARPAMATAYHLAVVVDDAAQDITLVTRGEDLFEATAIHVLLQRLLHLPTPAYHHHALVRDAAGKRLAKRDDARAIRLYRDAGWSAQALLDRLRATPDAAPMP